MMLNREKFDWETREDAETLMRAKQIKSDPQRLAKAKECINTSLNEMHSVVSENNPHNPSRRNNPAVCGKINTKF